jgi:hypothetical protein
VIRIGNINVRAEHIVIANLNIAAGVNHQVSVEIVTASDFDSPSSKRRVDRPKPASLGESVIVGHLNLIDPPASSLPFDPIFAANLHAEDAIKENPDAAYKSTGHSQKNRFQRHNVIIAICGIEDSELVSPRAKVSAPCGTSGTCLECEKRRP